MRASRHWLYQRITAIVLFFFVPGFWWLFRLINTSSYQNLHTKLNNPIVLISLSTALFFVLYHARLGLSIVIEDYTQQIKRKILLHLSDVVLLALLLFFIYAILIHKEFD